MGPASRYPQHDSAYPQADSEYPHCYSAYPLPADIRRRMLRRYSFITEISILKRHVERNRVGYRVAHNTRSCIQLLIDNGKGAA